MPAIAYWEVQLGAYRPGDQAFESAAGATVDSMIATLVSVGSPVAVRALSMYDHPGRSSTELAETIVRIGTDRYDPTRSPVHADFYTAFGVDLHAITCQVGTDGVLASRHYPQSAVVAGLMRDFDQGPPVDRGGVPLRVDLITVYDLAELDPVPVTYADGLEDDPTAFRFRDPGRAASSVVGVIILNHT